MAARTLPGLGLLGFYNLGEDGWKPGMDSNLRLLSAVTQLQVFSRVASEPGSPSEGDVYILTAGGNINKVAVYDNGEWVYLTPRQGWLAWIADENQYRKFSGTSWSILIPDSAAPPTAEDVGYDGGSGGPANVQEALDALFASPGGADDQTAAEVPYDGYTGGPANVQDALDELYGITATPAGSFSSVNAQTGTSYTPVLGDRQNVLITLDNAAAISLILPQDSDVAFPIGTVLTAMQLGAGLVSFQAGTGATVNSRDGALDSAGQYATFFALKRAANTWVVSGDIE